MEPRFQLRFTSGSVRECVGNGVGNRAREREEISARAVNLKLPKRRQEVTVEVKVTPKFGASLCSRNDKGNLRKLLEPSFHETFPSSACST